MRVELSTGLSVDEYLDRSFDPECELLGGETRPKPLGTGTHSRMEKRLTRLLEKFYGESRVQFELSVIIGPDMLIPDVVVLAGDHPVMHRDVLDEPPLLCVEVLSPSQRPVEMLAKCERYPRLRCYVLLGCGSGGVQSLGIQPGSSRAERGSRDVFRALLSAAGRRVRGLSGTPGSGVHRLNASPENSSDYTLLDGLSLGSVNSFV